MSHVGLELLDRPLGLLVGTSPTRLRPLSPAPPRPLASVPPFLSVSVSGAPDVAPASDGRGGIDGRATRRDVTMTRQSAGQNIPPLSRSSPPPSLLTARDSPPPSSSSPPAHGWRCSQRAERRRGIRPRAWRRLSDRSCSTHSARRAVLSSPLPLSSRVSGNLPRFLLRSLSVCIVCYGLRSDDRPTVRSCPDMTDLAPRQLEASSRALDLGRPGSGLELGIGACTRS